MQKAKIFVVFGFWIAVLPYLGFPIFLKNILFSITGLVLVYIGLVLRSKMPKTQTKKFDNFSENTWHEKPIPVRPLRQKLESIKEKVADINNTF
ncbi:MAG: hypothetical protein ACK4FA_00500 [Candidatus Paceibacteria bacterium]